MVPRQKKDEKAKKVTMVPAAADANVGEDSLVSGEQLDGGGWTSGKQLPPPSLAPLFE